MTTYRPDKWAIIEVSSEHGTFRKVLASWIGGYIDSDRWKLSSAIRSVEKKEKYYEFFNESGSIYVCHKEAYGISAFTSSILEGFKKQIEENPKLKLTVLSRYE